MAGTMQAAEQGKKKRGLTIDRRRDRRKVLRHFDSLPDYHHT